MSERKMSPKSLENLKKSNQESNAITRESLEISLLQLLEKKELPKITISELVNRAGVSRSAFYRNYSSKEEILEGIFKGSIQRMLEPLSQYSFKTELHQIWLAFFKAAKKEATIISLAIDYGMEKLLEQALFDFLEKRNQANKQKSGNRLNAFWSSTLVATLSKWVKGGMKVPAEKIANLRLPFLLNRKK